MPIIICSISMLQCIIQSPSLRGQALLLHMSAGRTGNFRSTKSRHCGHVSQETLQLAIRTNYPSEKKTHCNNKSFKIFTKTVVALQGLKSKKSFKIHLNGNETFQSFMQNESFF